MSRCYVDNAYNRRLGRVGMPHGSAVVSRSGGGTSSSGGYSRSSAVGSSACYGGGSTSSKGGSTTSSQRCYVDNAYNRSLGRVGMPHGTAVVSRAGGCTTSKGSNSAASSNGGRSTGCYVDNAQNRSLGRVGMPYGTAVVSRSGGGTTSRGSNGGGSATTSSQGCYVDNAYNRRLGRVGMPYGTAVVSQSGGISRSAASTAADGVRRYVDNPLNRRLGRVGKPIGTRVLHNSGSVTICDVPASQDQVRSNRARLISEYTLDELVAKLRSFGLSDSRRPLYQDAVDVMEQETIEEDWKTCGLEPVTDISSVSDHTPGEIIPYSELQIPDKKPIGRGGFGKVYAGKWYGTPIAYKKLLYQQMSRKLHNSFTKEVSILALLNHRCTIRMFGAVVEDGNIGIVMEYMHRSLHRALHCDQEIKFTQFTQPKKKSMVDQIASALEYLHGNTVQKIAHCDVKPANILLDKYDNVKLTDFGISAIKNATETSLSTVAARPGQGTPRYSAPEVLQGELLGIKQLMQTDIYSLAVVVFEILSEEDPYDGLNLRQLEAQVGRGTLRPTSNDVTFSRPVDNLLKRCWDRRADARPSAAEFRDAWSTIRVLCAE